MFIIVLPTVGYALPTLVQVAFDALKDSVVLPVPPI